MKRLVFIISVITNFIYLNGNSQSIYNGTSIIIFSRDDSVWIASDSRVAIRNKINKAIRYDTVCKINKHENIFYTLSGCVKITNDKNDQIVFDFKKVIDSLLKKSSTILDVGRSLQNIIPKELPPLFPLIENFLTYSNDTTTLMEVNFCGFVGNKPIFYRYSFYKKNNSKNVIMENESVRSNITILQGENKQMLDFLIKNRPYLDTAINISLRDRFTFLLNLEHKEFPDFVAAPYDILLITRDGYQWIENNSKCQF